MASATNTLGELLTTLLDRRPFSRRPDDGRTIVELSHALLSEPTEVSGHQLAVATLGRYQELAPEEKSEFFTFLNDDLDINADAIAACARTYSMDRSSENYQALSAAAEPKRQELFRKLNQAPGATAELVAMRGELLPLLKDKPELARTDFDITHLLKSWFNRGFLVLRQITWDSPASVLEKIIAYEAVHEIRTWDDLRRRLHPADRRCFAFFHPAMPDDPLIFVEVALTKGVPDSIQNVLVDNRQPLLETEANTAVFYSISNCQAGLGGISFGNSLIKQVVQNLTAELPNLKTFVTLSPIPRLRRWLEKNVRVSAEEFEDAAHKFGAYYLLEAKKPDGLPFDPVARFHLGNGAMVHLVHPQADVSPNGISQSGGAMVNYLYDPAKIPQNIERYRLQNEVIATSQVKSLAKQVAKDLG